MWDSFATLWTVARQAPLSMRFPKQKYRSGLPFPSPGDLADPGIQPASPHWKANSLPLSHQGSPKGDNKGFKRERKNMSKHWEVASINTDLEAERSLEVSFTLGI